MKLSLKLFALATIASSANAFSSSFVPSTSAKAMNNGSALKMSLEKYSDELKETAAQMVRPGFGLLACDESTGTVGTRLESIGLENVEENRQIVSFLYVIKCADFMCHNVDVLRLFVANYYFFRLCHDVSSGVSFSSPLPNLESTFLVLFSSKRLSTSLQLRVFLS